MKKQMSAAQKERQSFRNGGRYAVNNPCYRCGKSAGLHYFSVLDSEEDALGNNWGDRALCLCGGCGEYLQKLVETDPAKAWAETESKDWGRLPQGRGL